MLFKLAVRNVRRQVGSYLIYFITVMLTVATVFAVNNMIFSDVVTALQGMMADFVRPLLVMLSVALAAIMAFVLAYATTFLLRRRKKEFGLYLTLGFSRGNILSLFAGETALTFLVSLAAGSLLGFGLYYGLIEVFTSFIEWPYAPGGCTWEGSGLTLVMVAGVFLLASAFSLGYLRFAKISALLAGEGRVEKKVRLPWLWVALLAASVAAFFWSGSAFLAWVDSSDFYDRIGEMVVSVAVMLVSVFVMPLGAIHGGAWLLLRRNCCRSKGLGRVTLRHISARLGASSVMVGMLAILLAVAIVGPNVFMTMASDIEAQVNWSYRYDVIASGVERDGFSYEDGLQVIEKYADVEDYCIYTVYDVSGEQDEDGIWSSRYYITESDFSHLCAMLGYELPDLNGGRLFCTDESDTSELGTSEFIYTPVAGGESGVIGKLVCPMHMLSSSTVISTWTVLPDEQIGALVAEDPGSSEDYFAVSLAQEKFDARAMFQELFALTGGYVHYYTVREYERLDRVGEIGLILLGDLFVTGVFILLSVAVLALKALSLVAEDKPRYRILWRLGASEGRMQRSLFAQLAFFFLAPFAVALLINLPLTAALQWLGESSVVPLTQMQLFGQLAVISSLVFAVFALYLIAAFFVSWQDIRRNIRSEGRL